MIVSSLFFDDSSARLENEFDSYIISEDFDFEWEREISRNDLSLEYYKRTLLWLLELYCYECFEFVIWILGTGIIIFCFGGIIIYGVDFYNLVKFLYVFLGFTTRIYSSATSS